MHPDHYYIGQRVIYSNEIAIVCNPPKGKERSDANRMWIMRPAVGYESYVYPGNVKPLPNGQL